MSRKIFLSFLGTGNYKKCRYKLNDIGSPVKFIQEDLVNRFCKKWTKEDYIYIFLTNDARMRNWENEKGLHSILANLNLEAHIQDVSIPTGNNQDEIWEIFNIIFDLLINYDDIIIDITNSFRSLPMLLIVLLGYARLLKNIKIEGIYYGAFEVLGNYKQVESLDIEKRIVPIFDLKSLAILQEWINATASFVNNGVSKDIVKLIKEEVNPRLKDTKGKDEDTNNLNTFSEEIKEFTDDILLVRGKSIIGKKYSNLKNILKNLAKSNIYITPLNKLISNIDSEINRYQDNNKNNGFLAVGWCLKHNLYQQAITILQEVIITYILEEINKEEDKIITDRELVNQSLYIMSNNIKEVDWYPGARKNVKTIKLIICFIEKSGLKKKLNKLNQVRNDINHAGFIQNHMSKQNIVSKFTDVYNAIKEYIY